MQPQHHPLVFLSVFYPQQKWHLLLNELKILLLHNGQVQDFWLFFSHNRGAHIRVALSCATQPEELVNTFTRHLQTFFTEYPSAVQPQRLPIQSFFCDVPGNTIKTGLFSEEVLLPPPLLHLQSALSRILLCFFEQHPVDDEALFTLMLHLHYTVSKALQSPAQPQEMHLKKITEALSRKFGYAAVVHPQWLESFSLSDVEEGTAATNEALSEVQQATTQLLAATGSCLKTYLLFLKLIRHHIHPISPELFFDSACLLRAKLQQAAQQSTRSYVKAAGFNGCSNQS